MHVTVIGDGGWGTALGLVLFRNGHKVRIWGPFADYAARVQQCHENVKFLPGVQIPSEIEWTSDRAAAVKDAEIIVLASPSKFYRPVLEGFATLIPASAAIVSVSKGFDPESKDRLTVTAERVLGRKPVAALSGPSHAEEVARRIPSAVVIGCVDHSVAEYLQRAFNSPDFRVYTSNDVAGVELGGALKNVIAIAAGVSDGIGYGDNTKAALITRGLAEMTRLGTALGANPVTFAGLSGIGDLIVTCASKHSRNRGVGERLGKGQTLQDILKSMEQVAEGVWTCTTAIALAAKAGIEIPIIEQVNAILYEGRDPKQAVQALMSRDPKPERPH